MDAASDVCNDVVGADVIADDRNDSIVDGTLMDEASDVSDDVV